MSAGTTTRRWAPAIWLLAFTACLACGAAPRDDQASGQGQQSAGSTLDRTVPSTAAFSTAGLRRLHFDLQTSRVWVASADSLAQAPLGDSDLAGRWEAFRELLARDRAVPWSPAAHEMARALGRALLQPIAAQLQGATAWEVSPLELAPLGAVLPPWSSDDQPVQASVIVWYSAALAPPSGAITVQELADCVPSPQQQAAMPRQRGILAVAPFRPGVPPAQDDPDTMLWAMRRAARNIELIPRNDTGAAAIAGALGEQRYAMSWLRAAPEQAQALLPPLERGPLLLWWTLAAETPRGEPALGDGARSFALLTAVARGWLTAPRGIALDLWPRDPTGSQAGTVAFLDALRAGQGAAAAVREGCETLRAAGSPPAQWAGWIYVGNPALTATLQAPGWLQRSP